MSAALTVRLPALVTAAAASSPPVESTRVAPAAMPTVLLVAVPVRVSVPPVTASEPPPKVPDTSTGPLLVVEPNK